MTKSSVLPSSALSYNRLNQKCEFGSGEIRTHAPGETGALNQRLRLLGHATVHTKSYKSRFITDHFGAFIVHLQFCRVKLTENAKIRLQFLFFLFLLFCFFYFSGKTNSLSYSGKSLRKKSMLENFHANVLKAKELEFSARSDARGEGGRGTPTYAKHDLSLGF